MAIDPRALANYSLDRASRSGVVITNLALNKILYFVHGWHLAIEERPLIEATFEAWQYGPVVPLIYHQFKRFRDQPISSRATVLDFQTGQDVVCKYSENELPLAFIDPVLDFYSAKSGHTLSHMSHEPGAPWAQVRLDSSPGMIISNEVIRAYFAARLSRRSGNRNAN